MESGARAARFQHDGGEVRCLKGGEGGAAAIGRCAASPPPTPVLSIVFVTFSPCPSPHSCVFESSVGCGLLSLVLFRSPMMRWGFTTFGMGFGAGEAYRYSSSEFDKEKGGK